MKRILLAILLLGLGLVVTHLVHANYCPKDIYKYSALDTSYTVKQLSHVMFSIPTERYWYSACNKNGVNRSECELWVYNHLPSSLWVCIPIYIFIYFIWFRVIYLIITGLIRLVKK